MNRARDLERSLPSIETDVFDITGAANVLETDVFDITGAADVLETAIVDTTNTKTKSRIHILRRGQVRPS